METDKEQNKYNQEYYIKNKVFINEKRRMMYKQNGGILGIKERYARQKIREKKVYIDYKKLVYDHYGNKCNWPGCGNSNPYHLSIDHINNDGYHNKKNGTRGLKLYRQIVKDNFPDTFQILCHNHNYEKKLSYEKKTNT
jgi:hypothetical protein